MKHTLIAILTLGVTLCAHAQEVNTSVRKDSIDQNTPNTHHPTPTTHHQTPITTPDLIIPLPDTDPDQPDDGSSDVSRAIRIPMMAYWGTGGITGYNYRITNINGFGFHSGAILFQQWNKLTLTGSVSLSKDMINAVGVVNGIGGNMQLMYKLGRNASLTAFGGINHYGWMSPSPNMTSAYYGGFMTLNTNNGKWAVDLGVRQMYNNMTGRWETIPIVMPYYNLGGTKLGFDFGGLIYNAINSSRESVVNTKGAMEGRGPAIIAPPIDMKPKKLSTEVPKNMGNTGLK